MKMEFIIIWAASNYVSWQVVTDEKRHRIASFRYEEPIADAAMSFFACHDLCPGILSTVSNN